MVKIIWSVEYVEYSVVALSAYPIIHDGYEALSLA